MFKVKEAELSKLYYSIGEVAEMFGVNTSLIRFWEKEFSSIKPKKNKKGNRLFTPKEIAKIDAIYQLVKVNGYTLDGAKKALKSTLEEDHSPEENSTDELIHRLEEVKRKLLRLKR